MTMIIEEKYNNAIQMLHGYYDGKSERLRITSLVLKENGFNANSYGEFVSMTCPRLLREGILKESPFTFLSNSKEIIDQEKYNRLYSQWERVMSALVDSSGSDRYNPQYGFGPSPATTKKLAEKEDLEKEMASLERIFTFIIDGKKLEAAYKTRKATLGGGTIPNGVEKVPANGQSTNDENLRLDVIIDFQSGIYDASHPERIYEISGKRKKVVKYRY